MTPLKIDRSLIWFGVAGGAAFLVDVGILTLLREPLGAFGARAVSFWLAATTTWLINRNVSFADHQFSGGLLNEYLRYLGLMLIGGSLNLLVYSVLAWALPQTSVCLALYVAAGTVAGMSANYMGLNLLLYKKTKKNIHLPH